MQSGARPMHGKPKEPIHGDHRESSVITENIKSNTFRDIFRKSQYYNIYGRRATINTFAATNVIYTAVSIKFSNLSMHRIHLIKHYNSMKKQRDKSLNLVAAIQAPVYKVLQIYSI